MLGTRILVVDDELKIAQIVTVYLQRDGYQVLRAADGREALALARTASPSLIILDVMLPGVSGWDVVATCDAIPKRPTCRSSCSPREMTLPIGSSGSSSAPMITL
ncbi:MAG TPA: response regulator [Chloroflexota bacterium]|nr:response regulator [Chloroflexota bacterium]